MKPGQRKAIQQIAESSRLFTGDEVTVALELADIVLNKPDQKDYTILVYEEEGEPLGFITFGQRPMTYGTFDMYWIAVHEKAQNKGIGSKLLKEMENHLAGKAKLIVAETSGKPEYEPTRQFYLRKGFSKEAQIKNFYKPGDDLCLFIKRFN